MSLERGPRENRRKPTIGELKDAVRQRDGYRCTDCGITAEEHIALTGRTLDVHRLDPGSPYTFAGCVTLCQSCHGPKPRTLYGQAKTPLAVPIPFDLWLKAVFLAGCKRVPVRQYIEDLIRGAMAAEPAPPPAAGGTRPPPP